MGHSVDTNGALLRHSGRRLGPEPERYSWRLNKRGFLLVAPAHMRLGRYLAVTLAAAGVAGCASTAKAPAESDRPVASAASIPPNVVYSGPIRTKTTYHNGEITLIPPGSRQPALSWQTVYTRYCSTGQCDPALPMTVVLGNGTDPDMGTGSPPGGGPSSTGSTPPQATMHGQLVYGFLQQGAGVCGAPTYGSAGSDASTPPTVPGCWSLGFYDANTANGLVGLSGNGNPTP